MTETRIDVGAKPSEKIDAIERTLELQAAPDRVWSALVEKEQLDLWWGGSQNATMAPGFEGWFEWEGYGRFAYRVEAWEPGRHLAYRWAQARDTAVGAGHSTLVEFTLEARADGGTTLHLRESGFAEAGHRQENSGGWDEELGKLVKYLER